MFKFFCIVSRGHGLYGVSDETLTLYTKLNGGQGAAAFFRFIKLPPRIWLADYLHKINTQYNAVTLLLFVTISPWICETSFKIIQVI